MKLCLWKSISLVWKEESKKDILKKIMILLKTTKIKVNQYLKWKYNNLSTANGKQFKSKNTWLGQHQAQIPSISIQNILKTM